jgi:ankyrin repeat protein
MSSDRSSLSPEQHRRLAFDDFKVSNFSFTDCIESTNFLCILFLLSYSVIINTSDSNGRTPLSISLENGHTEIVTLLVDNGVHIDAKDKFIIAFIT